MYVLNLTSLLVHVPLDSSFVLTHFLVLNLDGWTDAASNKFFDILLLYYYTNLNSSIICCLPSIDIYLFFGLPASDETFQIIKIQLIWRFFGIFFQKTRYFISNFINSAITSVIISATLSNHQLLLPFFKLLFLMQFLLHPL